MKQSKLLPEIQFKRNEEFDKLIESAKSTKLSNEEEMGLLNEIRSGNREPIETLVNSMEALILIVAKQIPTEQPVEELVSVGKKELRKLAEQEVNSKINERFFRFGAWCVKQAMLQKVQS